MNRHRFFWIALFRKLGQHALHTLSNESVRNLIQRCLTTAVSDASTTNRNFHNDLEDMGAPAFEGRFPFGQKVVSLINCGYPGNRPRLGD